MTDLRRIQRKLSPVNCLLQNFRVYISIDITCLVYRGSCHLKYVPSRPQQSLLSAYFSCFCFFGRFFAPPPPPNSSASLIVRTFRRCGLSIFLARVAPSRLRSLLKVPDHQPTYLSFWPPVHAHDFLSRDVIAKLLVILYITL